MVTEERALSDLLYQGLDDWVPLHAVVWYATHGHIDTASQALVLRVLRRLFSDDLMVPGDLGETGFEGRFADLVGSSSGPVTGWV
jgi:hypothetical protein